MKTEDSTSACQIYDVDGMAEPLGKAESLWQLRNRIKRIAKRRVGYGLNWFAEKMGRRPAQPAQKAAARPVPAVVSGAPVRRAAPAPEPARVVSPVAAVAEAAPAAPRPAVSPISLVPDVQLAAPTPAAAPAADVLQPGDWVRIKSREEIEVTLNRWNQVKGCSLMEEMWPYCGTTHQVMKRVERFLDERTYKMRKARGIVLLDGVICQGTTDFGHCDRSCFFFWREEWLEKIDGPTA